MGNARTVVTGEAFAPTRDLGAMDGELACLRR